jgi:hypothetical protein
MTQAYIEDLERLLVVKILNFLGEDSKISFP